MATQELKKELDLSLKDIAGMTTLEKILKQDLLIAKEGEKLRTLKNQYILEHRKYPKNYFVTFDYYGTNKTGRIQVAYFKDDDKGCGIQYSLLVVTNSGEFSKRDTSFYYVFEDNLVPHLILNAMSNQ
jgi:PDZ domain-containing secreted protein